MQDFTVTDPAIVKSMKDSLSGPRFARYLDAARQNDADALALYQWNALLSQSLYIYIQCWEVCLRNKIDGFLRWKYSANWPYDQVKTLRGMTIGDRRRVDETRQRQEQLRASKRVSTDAIVADLSAGFWVSQLSGSYEIPYSWRYNLVRVFPCEPKLDAKTAWGLCERALSLRNRVAHHEPIFHLDLELAHEELRRLVEAMCPGTFAFADSNCSFKHVFANRPT